MPADTPRTGQAVQCRALAKTFGAGDAATKALSPLDLTFVAGQTTALVGPSGCGKSTLLRLVAGLETPSAGDITIGNETPQKLSARAGLAMAFQDPSLLPWRTVRQNIALALSLARMPANPQAVDNLIALVGLTGFEAARPAELSGGMRQRVAIARCMISEPELLLLDEPFGAVDELTRLRLNMELPVLWQARDTTALLVTHSITEAVLLSDRVIVFSPRPGRVVADIDVDLPQPRRAELIQTARFRACSTSVTKALWASDTSEAIAAQ